MRGPSNRLAACLIVAALIATACGSGASSTDTANSAEAPLTSSSAETTAVDTHAELFGTFPTLAGGQLDLGSLEGQDAVLWFWAPW